MDRLTGNTKARKFQTYLNEREAKWLIEFAKKHGLNHSQAIKLCLRHVRIEQQMKESGRRAVGEFNRATDTSPIAVERLVELRGCHGGIE